MVVLSHDPGMSGAVALFGPGILEVRRDFKNREDIARAILELGPRADVAVMELVNAMPGQGVVSMFSFGNAAGVAVGALVSAGFSVYGPGKPLIEVAPVRWQNYFWTLLGVPDDDRKEFDSKAVARRFLPAADPFLDRVKDHNTADALLMAVWYQCNPDATTSVRAKDKARKRRKKRVDRTASSAT